LNGVKIKVVESGNRYENIVSHFRKFFPQAKEFSLYRAPGRINLIGEHTDYNGFPVLPMATEQDITVCVSPRSEPKVVLKNTNPSFEDREFEIDFQIPPYPKGDWGNYPKAAFQTLQDYLVVQRKEKRLLRGMNILVDGNIPEGSGLSSSSALVVATAFVINDFNQFNLDNLSLADLLAVGERYVGTEGGGMDQAASLSGKKGMALKIDFFPLKITYIPFPEDWLLVVCNSLVDAKKSGRANLSYNQRVIECRLGTALLKKFLARKHNEDVSLTLLGDLKKSKFAYLLKEIEKMLAQIFPADNLSVAEVSSLLGMDAESLRERYLKLKNGTYLEVPSGGFRIKSRLRHVFTEAERVEKSKECIERGQMDKFGELMYQSHKSCAEDYEISCPRLDELVKVARQNGATGARLTGAGFGGCTVNLIQAQKADEFMQGMIRGYYKDSIRKESNLSDCIFVCRPSNGAQKLR